MKRPSAVPFWLDRFPKNRRPAYAPFKGDTDAAVVIVGGGLTGCACAASFAAELRSVAAVHDVRAGEIAGGELIHLDEDRHGGPVWIAVLLFVVVVLAAWFYFV